jgi:hypothetical protein
VTADHHGYGLRINRCGLLAPEVPRSNGWAEWYSSLTPFARRSPQ